MADDKPSIRIATQSMPGKAAILMAAPGTVWADITHQEEDGSIVRVVEMPPDALLEFAFGAIRSAFTAMASLLELAKEAKAKEPVLVLPP